MRIAVWIVSGLLAMAFLFIGWAKVGASVADLESTALGVPVALLKVAGVAEMLGALGIILPAATRVLPWLTPLAATGLVVTMIGATVTNVVIGEYALLPQTIILGSLAGFVVWARSGAYAVASREAAQRTYELST